MRRGREGEEPVVTEPVAHASMAVQWTASIPAVPIVTPRLEDGQAGAVDNWADNSHHKQWGNSNYHNPKEYRQGPYAKQKSNEWTYHAKKTEDMGCSPPSITIPTHI